VSTPNRKNPEELVKDLLWQNHALTQQNADLLRDNKRLVDELAKIKAAPPAKPERPSIVR
jgi:hypothetical protein